MKKKKTYKNTESGMYLIVMTVGFIVLIGMAGFAIDLSTIFFAKHRVEKAVNAGLTSGINFRIANGASPLYLNETGVRKLFDKLFDCANENKEATFCKDPVFGTKQAYINRIQEIGQEVTFRNLKNSLSFNMFKDLNVSGDLIDKNYLEYTYSPDIEQITSTMRIPVKLFLMPTFRKLIGVSDADNDQIVNINYETSITLRPAKIALILDNSGSMGLPEGTTTRIKILKEAVAEFLFRFKPNYDKISITTFQNIANVVLSMTSANTVIGNTTFGEINILTSWAQALSELDTGFGKTNLSDGLITAFNDSLLDITSPERQTSFIVFSDGAPSAARLFLEPSMPLGGGDNFDISEFDNAASSLEKLSGIDHDTLHFAHTYEYRYKNGKECDPKIVPIFLQGDSSCLTNNLSFQKDISYNYLNITKSFDAATSENILSYKGPSQIISYPQTNFEKSILHKYDPTELKLYTDDTADGFESRVLPAINENCSAPDYFLKKTALENGKGMGVFNPFYFPLLFKDCVKSLQFRLPERLPDRHPNSLKLSNSDDPSTSTFSNTFGSNISDEKKFSPLNDFFKAINNQLSLADDPNLFEELTYTTPDPDVTTNLKALDGFNNMLNLHYSQQYYNAAIAYSDFIRFEASTTGNFKNKFYVIGIGPDDPNIPTILIPPSNNLNSDDPYLNANSDDFRKDAFLARLAYDPFASRQIAGDLIEFNNPTNVNGFYNTNLLTWEDLDRNDKLKNKSTKGLYLKGQNINELNGIFRNIAMNILVNLS